MTNESKLITPARAKALPVGTHNDVITNLALVVSKTGVRSWRWRGRISGRPQATKIVLGHYPEMGPDAARAEALRLNGDRCASASPEAAAPHIASTAGPTCDEAHKSYMMSMRMRVDEHGRNLAPRYLAEKQRIWDAQLSPYLAGKLVQNVSRTDILSALKEIVGRSAANHALTEAKVFFNWCCHDPDIALVASPAVHLKKPSRERVRCRHFDPRGDELPAFLKAIHREDQDIRDAYLLLLLTGARKMQVLGAKGCELKNGIWTIPLEAERAKNGQPNALKLAPLALSIFNRRGNDLLFPSKGQNPTRQWGWTKINSRVKHCMEEILDYRIEQWSLHDLRRTVDSGLSCLGINDQIIERILSHKIQGAKRHYRVYDFLDEKASALLMWEQFLQSRSGVLQRR